MGVVKKNKRRAFNPYTTLRAKTIQSKKKMASLRACHPSQWRKEAQ